jgi:hypothetical protein
MQGGAGVRVGILVEDPEASDLPLALVCSFDQAVPDATMERVHRLAWNFCRTLLLITIEPHIIRKWSCCELPTQHFGSGEAVGSSHSPEIKPAIRMHPETGSLEEVAVARSLSWIELATGRFYQENADRFPASTRADSMLLSNLKAVRRLLHSEDLPTEYSHDLLARVIFTQFLFDRKDAAGNAALDQVKLQEFHEAGILSRPYTEFPQILDDYDDTYRLFRFLNSRFNGDLFPGKGETESQRGQEWEREQAVVRPQHLRLLAGFVRGAIDLGSGQQSLWPFYAFDAIPLEFISSVYEEFVNKDAGVAIHYTPAHIVDLMLDQVLPWTGSDWDVRVLDPACGSGIFLVKAFQRLIFRWKEVHQQKPPTAVLRSLLQNNLVGVDKDPDAVRVASFSLYLAMCDVIDPRSYWADLDQVQFPTLRGRTIVCQDFFSEDSSVVRTPSAEGSFDIVVANPPWGDGTVTPEADKWASTLGWPIANNDIGATFLAKAAALTRRGGRICMIQPVAGLLYNTGGKAIEVRRRLFLGLGTVESIVNLANFKPFRHVRVPVCIVTLTIESAGSSDFWYSSPRPLGTVEDKYAIHLEEAPVHFLSPEDAVNRPHIWSALALGGRRDLEFIERLRALPSISKLEAEGQAAVRQGVVLGSAAHGDGRLEEFGPGWHLLRGKEIPGDVSNPIPAQDLPLVRQVEVHKRDSTDRQPFKLPQIVIKTSWKRSHSRFQARVIVDGEDGGGVVSTRQFVTAHIPSGDMATLESCLVAYNSLLATYFVFLTSGRTAFDRYEPYIRELYRVPLPPPDPNYAKFPSSLNALDAEVDRRYGLNAVERILVEDFVTYTLEDVRKSAGKPSPSRRATLRWDAQGLSEEPNLTAYGDVIVRVLNAAYGGDKCTRVMIFGDSATELLPARLVVISLDGQGSSGVQIQRMQSKELRTQIGRLYRAEPDMRGKKIPRGRAVRTYEIVSSLGERALQIAIIKPDQIGYWTKSAALQDADEIASDLMRWASISEREAPERLTSSSGE